MTQQAQITVREFSAAGPCLRLGELVKQTASTVTYRRHDGSVERRGGHALKSGLVHLEACPSCRDHAHTQYAEGYMD